MLVLNVNFTFGFARHGRAKFDSLRVPAYTRAHRSQHSRAFQFIEIRHAARTWATPIIRAEMQLRD